MNRTRIFLIFPALLVLCLSCFLSGCRGTSAGLREPSVFPDAGTFSLTFLTIGKGDAFLLETPEHKNYLIDTGKAQDYVHIAKALRVKEIASLDGIFLTHGHKDHTGSLSMLLQAFPTQKVYYWAEDQSSYKEIFPREFVSKYGAELVSPSSGELLDLGGVTAEVFLPPVPDSRNENNNSMILMLTHGKNKFLMMGDAELEEESLLMKSGMDLKADILKLGHHGEDDASSPAFLRKVQPTIGLIAGNAEENPESLDPLISSRLKDFQIQAYYSESPGLGYCFLSDGKNIETKVLEDRDFPIELNLCFEEVNRSEQRVVIRNNGEDTADLSGCLIRSVKKDELFLFPEGTLLKPGEKITVACRDASLPGDLTWDADSVWQPKKDKARLYDQNLNLLDENLP